MSQPFEVLEVQTLLGAHLDIMSKDDDGKINNIFDPAIKVIAGLSSLSSVDGLANAKLKNSDQSLWDGQNKPSEDVLKTAAHCFEAITKGHKDLPSDGSKKEQGEVTLNGLQPGTRLGFLDEVKKVVPEWVMDGIHWLKEKIDDVKEWIVYEAGEKQHPLSFGRVD